MTTACSVRKLSRSDAGAWALLRREALEDHPLAFGSSVPEDPSSLVDWILPRLESTECSSVFGAFDSSSIPSLLGIVGILRDSGKKSHKAMIWGMYVTPRSQRIGVGGLLLNSVIREARSWSGVEQIHLSVSEDANDARRLYDRNGFREWGREPNALRWNNRSVDFSHMVLDLREFGDGGRREFGDGGEIGK